MIEKIQSPSYIDRQITLGTELIIRSSTKLPQSATPASQIPGIPGNRPLELEESGSTAG